AAAQLEELAMLARAEQLRRALAREWTAVEAEYVAAGLPPPQPPPEVTTPIEPPDIHINSNPPRPRNPSTSTAADTGQSSADPDDLDRWVNASRQLDTALSSRQATLDELQA